MPRPSPTRKIFGKKVRALRTFKSLSQEKLAEKAGLHPTFISMIERGTTNLSVDNMDKVAKALGCKVKDLL